MNANANTRPVRARYSIAAFGEVRAGEGEYQNRGEAAEAAANAARTKGISRVSVRVSRGDVADEVEVDAGRVRSSRQSFRLRRTGKPPWSLTRHLSPMDAADWDMALYLALHLLGRRP